MRLTFKEFEKETLDATEAFPTHWRFGQKIFNYIDLAYPGLGRHLQMGCGVDCFYNDNIVSEFLKTAYDVILKTHPEDLERGKKL